MKIYIKQADWRRMENIKKFFAGLIEFNSTDEAVLEEIDLTDVLAAIARRDIKWFQSLTSKQGQETLSNCVLHAFINYPLDTDELANQLEIKGCFNFDDAIEIADLVAKCVKQTITEVNVVQNAFSSVSSGIDQSEYLNEKLFGMYQTYQSNNIRAKIKKYFYAPYTTICQASGYGKSRAIELLANRTDSLFYVHYCCLRTSGSGYPNGTKYVTDLFLEHITSYQAKSMFRAYVYFLLNAIVDNKYTVQEFYQLYSTSEKTEHTIKFADAIKSSLPSRRSDEALKKRVKKPLLLVFDEARSLLPNNLFDTFLLALQEMDLPVFALFIDTSSKISNFVPEAKRDPTSRISSLQAILFPPIYMLPTFDAFRRHSTASNIEKVDSVKKAIKFESICSFGRPLWASWLNSFAALKSKPGSEVKVSERDLLSLAAQKLVGGINILHQFNEKITKIENVLAILSVRVGTIMPLQEATSHQLVSAHMATLVGVSKERASIEIAFPSEPVLALASAQYYWKSSPHVQTLIKYLTEHLRSSLIDKGAVGELAIKIALLHAFDRTHMTDGMHYGAQKKVYGKYVYVRSFIKSLLGKSAIQMIKRQLSPEKADQLLEGFVYFTHFYKADRREFQLRDMKTLMARGAAGEYKRSLKLVDFKLPVALKKDDFESMTCIQFQIKLCNDPKEPRRADLEAINLESCLDCSSEDPPPSLTIYIQLNGSSYIKTLVEDIDDRPKRKTASAIAAENKRNLACLYVQGIKSFNFDTDLIQHLCELCDTTMSNLDLIDQKIHDNDFDILHSPDQVECKLCNSTDTQQLAARCSDCQSLIHLKCEVSFEDINEVEYKRMASEIEKNESWLCSSCKRCSVCYTKNRLSTRCYVCLRWTHKKCMQEIYKQDYKFIEKVDTEQKYEFFSNCHGCYS